MKWQAYLNGICDREASVILGFSICMKTKILVVYPVDTTLTANYRTCLDDDDDDEELVCFTFRGFLMHGDGY